MTAKEAALKRLEAAIADKAGLEAHDHGSQGLSQVAAQDVALVADMSDTQSAALAKGCRGALAGTPEDAEPLIVTQKTWQVRHLIEVAKRKAVPHATAQ